jgi:hypothetical protein
LEIIVRFMLNAWAAISISRGPIVLPRIPAFAGMTLKDVLRLFKKASLFHYPGFPC